MPILHGVLGPREREAPLHIQDFPLPRVHRPQLGEVTPPMLVLVGLSLLVELLGQVDHGVRLQG